MERFIVKSFVIWLDKATDEQISERRAKFIAALANPMIQGTEAKKDIRLGIRLEDEELNARFEVFRQLG